MRAICRRASPSLLARVAERPKDLSHTAQTRHPRGGGPRRSRNGQRYEPRDGEIVSQLHATHLHHICWHSILVLVRETGPFLKNKTFFEVFLILKWRMWLVVSTACYAPETAIRENPSNSEKLLHSLKEYRVTVRKYIKTSTHHLVATIRNESKRDSYGFAHAQSIVSNFYRHHI